MSEPKRWIDDGPPEAVERLLRAAESEQPPDASISRTLVALGVGIGAAGSASTAAAAAGSGGGALQAAAAGKVSGVFAAGTLAKWGLLGAALVASGAAGKALLERHGGAAPHAVLAATTPLRVATASPGATEPGATSTAPPAASGASAEPVATTTVPSTASGASSELGTSAARGAAPRRASRDETAVATSAPASHRAPGQGALEAERSVPTAMEPASASFGVEPAAAPSVPLDAQRLAEEVRMVDAARAALARGDGAATLGALDAYETRFRQRSFAPEALYLRMEALLRLGRASEARDAAARLVARYPRSPNAPRARQVLAMTNP